MNRYRTIWVSDVHLGTRGCKADYLIDFLKNNDCETLYLVGDIIDGWRMRRGVYWPQSHSNVIRRVLTKAKRGTDVIYIAGNHDEFLRDYLEWDLHFGNIEIHNEYVHETIDGKKLWVIHGDQFDQIAKYAKWLAFLGDYAYSVLLWSNIWFNKARRIFGFSYWSLSSYLKNKTKQAVNFVGRFENAVAHECVKKGYDGVVCGHIHKAEIREIEKIIYCNDGDWVESCSALVENFDGSLEIVKWVEITHDSN